VELRKGVEATPQVRAVASIVASQLAAMFTPGTVASEPVAASPAADGFPWGDPAPGRP